MFKPKTLLQVLSVTGHEVHSILFLQHLWTKFSTHQPPPYCPPTPLLSQALGILQSLNYSLVALWKTQSNP